MIIHLNIDFKKSIYSFLGIPYIPEEIYEDKGALLLHISDTPEESYPYIMKVIEKINPQYVVHTGDMVDNIKLENNFSYLSSYENKLEKFINSIEKYNIKPYYVIGNHDNIHSIERLSKKGTVLEEGIVEIENNLFSLSHSHEGCKNEADYCLFGHNFKEFYFQDQEKLALNGLNSMNVIGLSTGRVYKINYPMSMNYYRRMERLSIGL